MGCETSSMKTLIFPFAPVDMEERKDADPLTTVTGGGVYLGSVVKALDRYGNYDRYYLIRNATSAQSVTDSSFSERVCFASLEDLPSFSSSDQVVLFTPDPAIHLLSPWRTSLNLPRAPITGIVHSMDNDLFFVLLMRHLLTGDMRDHDALICTSHSAKAVVEKALFRIGRRFERIAGRLPEFRPRLPVIPLGIWTSDFRRFARDAARAAFNFAPESVVFLYLGRFSTLAKADLAPLILAFCLEVAPRFPKARLVLAGDDTDVSLAPDLRLLASELEHGDGVLILPDISTRSKHQLFASADVFVSPSDNIQETFGLTLVEAMAAGLPVIASDWNGYKDIVVPGHTGFLVPTYMSRVHSWAPSSGPGMLSSGLLAAQTVVDMEFWVRSACDLAANPDLRQRMGVAGRSLADRDYDWAVVIRNYEALWDELFMEAGKVAKKTLPTEFAKIPFDGMGFQSVFDHYPTGMLANQILEVNPATASLMSSPAISHLLLQAPFSCREDIFAAVFKAAKRHTSSTAYELAASVSRELELPESCVTTHLARLLKYGVLRLRQEGPSE